MPGLGTYGGDSAHPEKLRRSAFGGSASSSGLVEESLDRLNPSPEGDPASSAQMAFSKAGFGQNLIKNGSFTCWQAGLTSEPEIWDLTGTGAAIARDTTNVKDGNSSAKLTNGANETANLSNNAFSISSTNNQRLQGKFVTASAQILASVSGRVYLQLGDGSTTVNSPYHTGGGAFEELHVSMLLSTSANQIAVKIIIDSGSATDVYIDSVIVVEGQSPVAYTEHPNDAHLRCVNHQTVTPTNLPAGMWRIETGVATASASVAVAITFATAFERVLIITLAVDTSTDNTATFENETASGFDLSCWTQAGARASKDVRWTAWGIV